MADPGSNGVMVRTALNTSIARSIAVASAKLTISNGDGVAGNPTLDFGSVASTDLSDTANIVRITAANTYNDGLKQTFNPDGTNAGFNVGAHTGDPSAGVNGDMYYNSTTNKFMCYQNGAWRICGSGGYYEAFTGQTTVTVLASTHGFGTSPIVAQCWDSSENLLDCGINWDTATGDTVFTFATSTTGFVTIVSGSGSGSGGGGGTVTSVALTVPSILSVSGSPVTTSGTFAVTLATQTANTVFAGPTTGGAATPTFRALVKADLPATVVHTDQANTYSGGGLQDFNNMKFIPPITVVGLLPSAAANTNVIYIVTDGTSLTDCTVGGGSTRAWCISNGAAWVPTTASSTGLGDPGSNGIVYRNGVGTSTVATATEMSGPNFCQDSVGTDAYACSLSPAITSYTTGLRVWFKAGASNTGNATLNLNSLGAVDIYRDPTNSLIDRDIKVNQWVEVIYNGTQFQLVKDKVWVGPLTSAPAYNNETIVIVDAAYPGDCTIGGGSTLQVCEQQSSAYVPVGKQAIVVVTTAVSGSVAQYELLQWTNGATRQSIIATASSTKVVGIAAVAASLNTRAMVTEGDFFCSFSAATTRGNLFGVSSTSGKCLDLGTSDIYAVARTAQVLGYVIETIGVAGTAAVHFWGGSETGKRQNVDDLNGPTFCSDAGANDTYACSLSPAPTAYVTGNQYRFKANTINTGDATINFNGIGPITIKRVIGGITANLRDGDILAGQWVTVVYDGTNMQLVSPKATENPIVARFSFNGGGAVIVAANTNGFWVDRACTINAALLEGDVSGSVTVNIYSAAYNVAPSYSIISHATSFALSSAVAMKDTTLTGWTTAVAADTFLQARVIGTPSTITNLTVTLRCI